MATAVQLRFDARHSPSLPEPVQSRLEKLAGARLTKDGVIVIFADRRRTQERNRADALDRLLALIRRAAERPKPAATSATGRPSSTIRLTISARPSDVIRAF